MLDHQAPHQPLTRAVLTRITQVPQFPAMTLSLQTERDISFRVRKVMIYF